MIDAYREKIIKARMQLLNKQPFLGFISVGLQLVDATDRNFLKWGDFGVDKYGRLYYTKQGLDRYQLEELVGIFAHEVFHIALDHLNRRESRDQFLWNVACDHAINLLLRNEGFTLPEGTLYNPDYEGLTAEEIYDKILESAKKVQIAFCDEHVEVSDQGEEGHDQGNNQDQEQHTKIVVSNGEQLRDDIRKLVENAYKYSKQRGQLPHGIERYFDYLEESKVDWKTLLRRYVIATIPKDYTYLRPNKKSQMYGVYLPGIKKENIIEVFFAVDTSGSISQDELDQFLAEVIGFAKTFPNNNFYVMSCDAQLYEPQKFRNVNDLKRNLQISGGGGTSFIPVFEYIQKNHPRAKLLVYFTDLYGDQDELNPPYHFRTLWVVTENHGQEPPFGDVIYLG